MKMSELFMPTLREVPAEAVIASHRLMLRAAVMRKLSNGLFAYLPLGLRAFRKVEAIIREEMDAIGAMEFKPPVMQPGEFWKESGRWDTMGDAMLKAKSRTGIFDKPDKKPIRKNRHTLIEQEVRFNPYLDNLIQQQQTDDQQPYFLFIHSDGIIC